MFFRLTIAVIRVQTELINLFKEFHARVCDELKATPEIIAYGIEGFRDLVKMEIEIKITLVSIPVKLKLFPC